MSPHPDSIAGCGVRGPSVGRDRFETLLEHSFALALAQDADDDTLDGQ